MSAPRASSLRARPYTPTTVLPSERPQLPSQPCAACGGELDPLRAACALAFEDGVRLLCSEVCLDSYRSGERMPRRTGVGNGASGTTLAQPGPARVAPGSRAPAAPRRPPSAERERTVALACIWIGAATIGTAALLAGFAGPELALAAAILTSIGALAVLRLTQPVAADVSLLGWLLGPLGAVGAAGAAYAAARSGVDGARVETIGAVLAAGALLARGILDTRSRAPLTRLQTQLLLALPERVHLPKWDASDASPRDPGTAPANDNTASDAIMHAVNVRVGEEIVAGVGEQLGVDGVVRAGEGVILPYPGATLPIRRVAGDAVFAGGRVTEGAMRVLAHRVGDDRAVARVARLGRTDGRGPARLLRLTQRAMPWLALLCLLASIALCISAHMHDRALPLSAASALLIAAPLLALRRAGQSPLQAAAAAAGARGILFQSGAALDLAGRISVVVMAPHRTLTEGKPELIDMLALGDADPKQLLALAAGAELSAGDHPIGRAIVRYADKRGIAPSEMRRAMAVQGRGLTGTGPDGEDIVIGSRRLLLDRSVSVAAADAYAARAEAAGRTAVFMAVAGHVRGVFALQDRLRTGARAAVQRLFDLGIEVVLLTGDQRGPVEQLAAGFDIAHIKCELLPDERAQEVRSLRDASGPVAVIGYPSDDAAALAAADVAIALGATASSGDNAIALLSEDLRDAAAALWIARAARTTAYSALWVSLAAYVAVLGAAALGLITAGLGAALALLVDVQSIPSGARLLRRIALRFGSSR